MGPILVPKLTGTPELALGPRPPDTTLTRWLYDELRRAMLTGRLKRGTRLPATRDFAGQHGISRRIVVNVFEQLRTEGYLVSRVGSGTRVSDQFAGRSVAIGADLVPRSEATPDADSVQPSIFAALTEQLGLRLEANGGPHQFSWSKGLTARRRTDSPLCVLWTKKEVFANH